MSSVPPVYISAYAKINLTLAVLGRREDGYHRLASVMQTISLSDTLRIGVGGGDRFTCDVAELSAPDNLVARAAALLRAETGRPDLTAEIELHKEIPAQGGLGGGSSDAATALVALDTLWGLGLGMERLEQLAGRLGSDTPYLVRGGTALIGGRGEVVTPLPDAEPLWIVLVRPSVAVSTAKVFGALAPMDYRDATDTEAVVAAIRSGETLSFDHMTNSLERGVLEQYPEVRRARDSLFDLGAPFVRMSGSGPSLFSPYRALDDAARLARRAREQGFEVWLCHTTTQRQVRASRP